MTRKDPNTIRRILTPPVFEDDARTDTAWILHWLVWSVAGLITANILLLIPLVGENPIRFTFQALSVDILCAGMIILIRKDRVELASRFLVTGMWLLAVFTVVTSGGLNSPALATFLLAIAYTALFLDRKWATLSVVSAAAIFAALAYMQVSGILPEPAITHTPWSRALAMTTYSIILVAALALLSETLKRSRKRTERELAERRAAEDEVRTLNSELESRVWDRTRALEAAISELEDANSRLAAATHAKSDFLAAMSHELRTPLNSVIGFSGILSSGMAGELNSEQKRQVEMIGVSGRLLLDLVNKVLDLTKVEAGTDEVALVDFDLGEAIQRIVDLTRPLAEDKSLEISCQVDERLQTVRSDRLRFEQALLNLVGNAVKFTEHGKVSVVARPNGSSAIIEVEDTGPGIPSDELKLVFDQFYQVRPDSGAKHEGAGLGLPLAQQLVESVGGSVEAESVLGQGSTFRIRLPL